MSGDTMSYEINVENSHGLHPFDTAITIGTESENVTQNISITAKGIGIWSSHSSTGSSAATLYAEGTNSVTANMEGLYSYGTYGSSKIELFAGENNTVTSTGENGEDGIYSVAYYSGGSSEVTLTAGGSNSVSASVNSSSSHGIYSQGLSGTSTVTLKAVENNTITANSDYSYGISSHGTYGSSIVELSAGESNSVTGNDRGIYSYGNTDGNGTSTVTLSAASNAITADTFTGTAIYSLGNSTVNIFGATTLAAATGADARDGGNVYFYDDVIANTATAATADGSSSGGSASAIWFIGGLSNEGYASLGGTSIIQATNGGVVLVNALESGVVNYTGTTSIVDENNPSRTYGTIDMYLTSDSVWNMTGDSSATLLSNGGLLDMTADAGAFSTLTLDTLSGDGGIIQMDIDASTNVNNSDRIYVDGTHTNTHYITLNNVGSNTDGAEGTVLVSVGDEQGQFKANDIEGTLYWERYTLASQENTTDEDYSTDWYLADVTPVAPEERETTTLNTVMSAASLNYHSWMMQNTKLLQRLGDLRQGANNGDNGAWFRISGSKLELGGEHGFENEYIQYEVGYDKIVEQNSQFTMYGGLAITYADGDSSYNRGDGDNESKAVSLYFTQINKGGSYLDVVFKLGRWENDFTAYDTSYNRIEGKTENTGMSVSAELGKKFALGNRGLYIEPQAQLTYGHFDGDSYTTSNGVNVHSEGIESLVGRAGFNLGCDINPRANVYLKANVLYEFLGDYGITLSDDTGRVYKNGDYSDTWFLYGIGASFKLGKPNSGNFLHFDVERSTGGDLDQEWFYNVGFRFEM